MDPSTPVSSQALAAFKKQHLQIVLAVTGRILAEPGAFDHLGDRAEKTIMAGVEFATMDLETVLLLGEPALLDQQILWAHDRLSHDGISPRQMLKSLETYVAVVAELLPAPLAQEVNSLVQRMIDQQRSLL
jgi:hypothetical protein